MESNTVMDIQIDQKVLMRLVERIVKMEHENSKTGKLSPTDMVDEIRRIIALEVDKK
jgi:hypothetical protein